MVDTSKILELAKDYESFFSKVIKTSIVPGDIESAEYGFEQSLRIIKMLEKPDIKLTNKQLKELYNIFTNMTRGVEYFQDHDTELEQRRLGERLFPVWELVQSKIKW